MRIDECYEDCMNIDPEKKMIARTIYAVEQRDIRLTLGNLAHALAALERLPGRKTLLFVSEGFLLLPREKAVPYERAIELARRANVVVEWIDPSGVTAGPVAPTAEAATKLLKPVPDPRDQPAFSRDAELAGTRFVATSTGGREFFSNDPTDGARRALDESSVYYLIGYVPVGGPPGERKVRVQVKREGCTVRARSRYFVRAPEAAAVGGAALRQAVDAFADASELPFRLAVEPADSAISMNDIAGSRLLVAIDPAGGPPRERTLEMLVEARPLGVGEPVRESVRLSVPAASRPLGVARPLALGPGVWQVRVALQDVATGALGSARQTVEVPADR
ncbi:MAG TPA: hypothetical protein VEQ10_09555, partial [Vicinamibacteria bacterium]|nr:hypothetical protein [Vicinamibacteria bacterium]